MPRVGSYGQPLSSMRFTGIDPVAGELFCEEVAERIGAWASIFGQRMLLLDRMDRQSNPSQFGGGCKCLDSREINGRGEWV
jgi:hypothetical protein